MPGWVEVVLWVAGAITAAWVIWDKALHPFIRAVGVIEKAVPVITSMTEQMATTPDVFKILNEMASQFRTDSGSSLRDVVNRIEASAGVLEVNVETARRLAEQDRAQLERLVDALIRVNVKIDVAASDAAGVAADLEDSHLRAEAHDVTAQPGEASDAAMRRPTAQPEGDSIDSA